MLFRIRILMKPLLFIQNCLQFCFACNVKTYTAWPFRLMTTNPFLNITLLYGVRLTLKTSFSCSGIYLPWWFDRTTNQTHTYMHAQTVVISECESIFRSNLIFRLSFLRCSHSERLPFSFFFFFLCLISGQVKVDWTLLDAVFIAGTEKLHDNR